MTESVQAANIIGSVLAEPTVKITVECRPSGHLDLPSTHHILTRSCKCISFCGTTLMKTPHVTILCEERAQGGLSSGPCKLKNVGNSGG